MNDNTSKKIVHPWVVNTLLLIFFISIAEANNGEYNTATEILILDYGSREISMAGAVLTNSMNESAVFWNPALLGTSNKRYQSGAFMYHFDKPFPISSWPAERHHSITACFQPASKSAGGFGINVSHYNRGERNWTDEWGRTLESTNYWEGLYSFTWGFGFQELGVENHQFGVTAKYIHSALFGATNFSIGRSGIGLFGVF